MSEYPSWLMEGGNRPRRLAGSAALNSSVRVLLRRLSRCATTRCTTGQWRARNALSPEYRQTSATAWRYCPSLSFSATGSAPRASTQHGTFPERNT